MAQSTLIKGTSGLKFFIHSCFSLQFSNTDRSCKILFTTTFGNSFTLSNSKWPLFDSIGMLCKKKRYSLFRVEDVWSVWRMRWRIRVALSKVEDLSMMEGGLDRMVVRTCMEEGWHFLSSTWEALCKEVENKLHIRPSFPRLPLPPAPLHIWGSRTQRES